MSGGSDPGEPGPGASVPSNPSVPSNRSSGSTSRPGVGRIFAGVSDLEVRCIVGAHPDERMSEQSVFISFEIEYAGPRGASVADTAPEEAAPPTDRTAPAEGQPAEGQPAEGQPAAEDRLSPGERTEMWAGPRRDELSEAVDYSEAADRVRAVAAEGRYVLLETLAKAVAEELSRDSRVARLSVECRKPAAREDAAHAYARVSWERTA